jgi:hypothetical protein
LIEGLTAGLDEDDRAAIQEAVDTAQNTLAERDEVQSVAQIISDRLQEMVGPAHATPISLGITPTRIDALLRALRLLIDGGARGIADASPGTANLIYLALKSLELDRLVGEGERDHTFLAVEDSFSSTTVRRDELSARPSWLWAKRVAISPMIRGVRQGLNSQSSRAGLKTRPPTSSRTSFRRR